ncbi:hypothetical protein CRUP_032047 [Coryphaenoides rupestris]|nr:hypothetical protein CRUP_032047 [Coryphaenoides rupestris]
METLHAAVGPMLADPDRQYGSHANTLLVLLLLLLLLLDAGKRAGRGLCHTRTHGADRLQALTEQLAVGLLLARLTWLLARRHLQVQRPQRVDASSPGPGRRGGARGKVSGGAAGGPGSGCLAGERRKDGRKEGRTERQRRKARGVYDQEEEERRGRGDGTVRGGMGIRLGVQDREPLLLPIVRRYAEPAAPGVDRQRWEQRAELYRRRRGGGDGGKERGGTERNGQCKGLEGSADHTSPPPESLCTTLTGDPEVDRGKGKSSYRPPGPGNDRHRFDGHRVTDLGSAGVTAVGGGGGYAGRGHVSSEEHSSASGLKRPFPAHTRHIPVRRARRFSEAELMTTRDGESRAKPPHAESTSAPRTAAPSSNSSRPASNEDIDSPSRPFDQHLTVYVWSKHNVNNNNNNNNNNVESVNKSPSNNDYGDSTSVESPSPQTAGHRHDSPIGQVTPEDQSAPPCSQISRAQRGATPLRQLAHISCANSLAAERGATHTQLTTGKRESPSEPKGVSHWDSWQMGSEGEGEGEVQIFGRGEGAAEQGARGKFEVGEGESGTGEARQGEREAEEEEEAAATGEVGDWESTESLTTKTSREHGNVGVQAEKWEKEGELEEAGEAEPGRGQERASGGTDQATPVESGGEDRARLADESREEGAVRGDEREEEEGWMEDGEGHSSRGERRLDWLIVEADERTPEELGKGEVLLRARRAANRHPHFSLYNYQVQIAENQPPGTSVIAMSATDSDPGDGGKVTYSMAPLMNSRSSDYFHISPESGLISSTQVLDREHMDQHYFRITAADFGSPRLSGTTMVAITVSDRNDHSPIFEQTEYRETIRENVEEGYPILQLRATDLDSPSNANIRYRFIGDTVGMARAAFEVDPRSGLITTRGLVDRETNEHYTLQVEASDQGKEPSPRSATVKVFITVLDENDNVPQFSEKRYVVSVRENMRPHSEILRVSATDQDKDSNAAVHYNIISGNSRGQFNIDSVTGEIQVVAPLDYESEREYTLRVRAQDNGRPPLSNNTGIVSVQVTDVNDNPPIFVSTPFQASVLESAPIGSSILHIQAIDTDSGDNARLEYRLTGTSSDTPFVINSATGMGHRPLYP